MAGILNEVQAWVVGNQTRIDGNDYDSLVAILRNLQDIDIRAHRPKPIVNLVHRKLSECLEIFRKAAFRSQVTDAVRTAIAVGRQLIFLCGKRLQTSVLFGSIIILDSS